MTQTTLTNENANKASTIINKQHPEWGEKRFNYREYMFDGRWNHSWGVGPNSAMLIEAEFKFWDVVSWK